MTTPNRFLKLFTCLRRRLSRNRNSISTGKYGWRPWL